MTNHEQISRSVILTGASRGIGHATVRRFSGEGWRIITCSRDEIPDACQYDPNWTAHIPTDLSDPASVSAFIEEANAALKGEPLHALVNNAAVSPKTEFKERLGVLNGDIDIWRKVYELNLFAPLTLSRGFASALGKEGHGTKVRQSSTSPRSPVTPSIRLLALPIPHPRQPCQR